MTHTEIAARSAVVGGCLCEALAIVTPKIPKVPTVSTICRAHHSLALGLVGTFLLHIYSKRLY